MVNNLSILGMVFTMLISFAAPVVLAFVLYRRRRYSLVSLIVGAATFVISQIIIRIPLLNLVSNTSWHQQYTNSIFYLLLIYALSAGVFEETGRLIGFRFFRKKHLDWENAVAFGIGHGGIEAMMLVGMQSINNILLSLMINTGSFSETIAPTFGEQAEQIELALTTTPASHFFLAGIERLAVLPVHIALSVLVCLAVAKRKYLFVILAIILHGLVNAPAVLASPFNMSIYVIEGLILLMAIVAIWYIFKAKAYFKTEDKQYHQ